jgi:hypothetical protein
LVLRAEYSTHCTEHAGLEASVLTPRGIDPATFDDALARADLERSASYYVRPSEIGRIAALRYNGTKTSIVTAAHALLQPAR